MQKEIPPAIMINVPEVFIKEKGERVFRRVYERMGMPGFEEECFYHFISNVPVHKVCSAFVCFLGCIQYKVIVVDYLRNQPINLPGYQHPARDWLVVTGPVIAAPAGMMQKGFRGFRYTQNLF